MPRWPWKNPEKVIFGDHLRMAPVTRAILFLSYKLQPKLLLKLFTIQMMDFMLHKPQSNAKLKIKEIKQTNHRNFNWIVLEPNKIKSTRKNLPGDKQDANTASPKKSRSRWQTLPTGCWVKYMHIYISYNSHSLLCLITLN